MTVGELIEKLKSFDQNLLVTVDGYECGYNDIGEIAEKDLGSYDADMDWAGCYDDRSRENEWMGPLHPYVSYTKAINISRYLPKESI